MVRILDKFTELTEALIAELTARKKQYEFYRNKLLTFDDVRGGATSDVVWKSLAEIADISTGSSNTDDAVEGGCYPFFVRSQQPLAKDEYEYERRNQSAHECTGRDVSSFENFVKYVYNEDFKED